MKKCILLPLCIVLIILSGCGTSKSTTTGSPEQGMFKVAILYPSGEDKTFDMSYYENTHMPMMAGYLGSNLKFYEIDKGIAGRMPGDKAPFVAVGYFYVKDVAEYNKTISQNRDAILSDIRKYTNIQPTVQISEISKIWYNK